MSNPYPEPTETTDSDEYTHVDPSELEDGDELDSTSFPIEEG